MKRRDGKSQRREEKRREEKRGEEKKKEERRKKMRDEQLHAVVARSTFPGQNVKRPTRSEHFWTFRCRFAWQAQGIVHLVKNEQNVRVLSLTKNDGRRGACEEDLQRCIFHGRRSTRDMFIRAVRRSRR